MAAGQSRRMGGVDKLMLPFKGQTLLEDRVATALKTGNDVYVVLPSKTDFPDRWSAIKGSDATLFECPDSKAGMGQSLAFAFRRLPAHYAGALIFLADMPALETSDLSAMCQSFQPGYPLRATGEDGAFGHPVIIPQTLFSKMTQLTGDQGARMFLRGEKTQHIQLPDGRAIIDIDTPSDWDVFLNSPQASP